MKNFFSSIFVAVALLMSVSAQAKQYCHESLTQGDNTIYLTCEKLSEGNYQIVVEADVDLAGLGGSFCEVNGVGGYQLNAPGHFVISEDKRKITCAIESTVDPRLYTPLYVLMPGEVNFGEINNIEWGLCNADDTEYTITLVQPAAGGTIAADFEKAVYGTTVTLTAIPAEGMQLDAWDVKDADQNVIAVNRAGKFTMPAANVTVTATFKEEVILTPATYSGTQVVEGVATFAWSITRNADQTLTFEISWDTEVVGAVPQITVGAVQFAGMTLDGMSASYTTVDTFEDGDKPTIFFYVAYAGGAARIDVDYTVGESNSELSSVTNVTNESRVTKSIVNGQLIILRDGERFTLIGTRVE